jgi:uncharacterized membrane protein
MDRLTSDALTAVMTNQTVTLLAGTSAVASAAAGGMMFVFSTFVMRGLDRSGAVEAIDAMRGINAEAKSNGPFLLVYFGAALLAVAVGVIAARDVRAPGSLWLLAGAVLGVLGALVTVAANVPLNEGLDTATASPQVWQAYLTSWVRWNHVRTVASLAGAALTMVAVVRR